MRAPPPRTRRELLKLSPLLLFGSFAVPSWREPLLGRGVAWSDRASDFIFRRDHLAASHRDADVVPIEQFPYNGYDVIEPEIDFANWTLTVTGAVARPGAYTLDQIRALPKQTHNTRPFAWRDGMSSAGSVVRASLTFCRSRARSRAPAF